MNTTAIVIGTAAVAACFYLYIKKHSSSVSIPIERETVEGEVHFDDIVEWFKMQKLDHEQHVPFLANQESPKLKSIIRDQQIPENYKGIYLGIFNQSNDSIEKLKLLIAKNFDAKTNDILGEEDFVVLA